MANVITCSCRNLCSIYPAEPFNTVINPKKSIDLIDGILKIENTDFIRISRLYHIEIVLNLVLQKLVNNSVKALKQNFSFQLLSHFFPTFAQ